MKWTQRRHRFRSQINSEQCVYPGSVYDSISARIAEDLGYEIGMFAGSIASTLVLLPELGTQDGTEPYRSSCSYQSRRNKV